MDARKRRNELAEEARLLEKAALKEDKISGSEVRLRSGFSRNGGRSVGDGGGGGGNGSYPEHMVFAPKYPENSGYPGHMVFDLQYPGWYYDTIAQKWYSLENYNSSPDSSIQAHNQQSQNGGGGGDGGGGGGSSSSGRGSEPNNRDNDGNGGSGGRNSKIPFKEKGGFYDNRTGKRPAIDKDYPVGQLVCVQVVN